MSRANRDLRGVGICGLARPLANLRPGVWNGMQLLGYLWSMWKLQDRSAARLAVGDEPRGGFMEK